MTFDLTTFILEIVNFLVLMWLLQRFLYKPVLKTINERKLAIENQVREAQSVSSEAQSLKAQYKSQLDNWEKEKAELQESLRSELRDARKAGLEKVRLEIEEETSRVDAVVEFKRQAESVKMEECALALAAQFAGAVLTRLASADLERDICKIFLEDLANLDKERLAAVHSSTINGGEVIYVTTAYPLAKNLQASVTSLVNEELGEQHIFEFSQDPLLIAGIKLVAGGTVLQANLADALTFFQGKQANGNSK